MSSKINTLSSSKKDKAAERAHEEYTDCIIMAEKLCMGKVMCQGCGQKVKVKFPGKGKQMGAAKQQQKKLSPQDHMRQRNMCEASSLSNREKKELVRIANVLGLRGISMRLTKNELCQRIRRVTLQ